MHIRWSVDHTNLANQSSSSQNLAAVYFCKNECTKDLSHNIISFELINLLLNMQVLLCYALFIKLVYKLLLSVACMHEGKKSTAAPYRSRHVANLPTKHCISAGQNSVYLYAVVAASGF